MVSDMSSRNKLMDGIQDRFDAMFRNGDFDVADAHVCFAAGITWMLTTDVMLAILTATLPAKSKLPSRRLFREHAEQVIRERGEWEDGLLDGL